MKKTINTIVIKTAKAKFYALSLFFLLPVFSLQAKFNPPQHVYGGDDLYIQITSAQELAINFKEFYTALRENNAQEELQSLGKAMGKVNILDKEVLQNMGLDIDAPVILSVKNFTVSNLNNGTISFQVYLPAADSYKLFNSVIDMQVTEEVDPQSGEMLRKQEGKKISRDLYAQKTKEGELYVIRTDDFVRITNNSVKLTAYPSTTQSWQQDPLYQRFLVRQKQLTPGTIQLLVSSEFGNDQTNSLQSLLGKPFAQLLQSYNNEMEKNLQLGFVSVNFNKKGVFVQSNTFYKQGYLQDPESKIFNIFPYQVPAMSADFIGGKPLIFAKFAVQPNLLSSLISSLRQTPKSKINGLLQKVESNLNANLEHEVIPLFSGGINLRLQEIPPLNQLKDFLQWKFFLFFSLNKEKTNNTFAKLAKIIENLAVSVNSKEGKIKMSKMFSFGGKLWTIGKSDDKPADTFLSFFLDKEDLVISGNFKHLKDIKRKQGNSIEDKVLKKDVAEEDFLAFLFVDFEQINRYLRKETENSPARGLAKIASFLKNITSLYSYAKIEGDEMKGKFILQLK